MYFMNNLEINISYSQIKDQMADCFHKFWYSFTYLLTAVRIGFFWKYIVYVISWLNCQ